MTDDDSSTPPATTRELRSCVASRVRATRKKRGWTQQQLAERAGIDRTHLARFETQAANVSLEVLFRLAAALNVRPCKLLLGCDRANFGTPPCVDDAPGCDALCDD